MPTNSAGTNDFDPISLLEDTSGNSFRANVFKEIDELIADTKDRAIGYAIASHLEPTGWLPTPLTDIAKNLQAEVEVVEAVLSQLQKC